MNKILVITFLLGVLFFGANFVSAQTANQDVETSILPDLSLGVNPSTLQFPNISPGASSTVQTTLTAGNSNIIITQVSVTPIIGTVFTNDNMMFDMDGSGPDYSFESPGTATKYFGAMQSFTIFIKLNVPVGTQSGQQTGLITYTIMEDI